MGFLRLASAIVAFAFLVGCTHPKSAATLSRSDLIEAYRRAHDHGDMQAMMNLFCWDEVTAEVRAQTEDVERGKFALKILELKVTTGDPVERMKVLSYVKDNITYRFNLPVVAALAIYFSPLSKESESVEYYALGTKDGRYLIALMAPMKQHTQNAPASESVEPIPVRTTQAARRQEKPSQ
jgi:hypothetical protein